MPGVFDSDEEADEFNTAVRAWRERYLGLSSELAGERVMAALSK